MTWRDRSRLLATALFLGLGLVLLWPLAATYAREFWLVDECLTLRGSFDYARMTCDRRETHPYIPFASRHKGVRTRFTLGLALLVVSGYTHVVGTVATHGRSRPAV